MTIYRTVDGCVYKEEKRAIAHNNLLEFNLNGGFDVFGMPYKHLKIDRSEDGGKTWR
jgi:hypothetical protein